jgi:hypothetical protein
MALKAEGLCKKFATPRFVLENNLVKRWRRIIIAEILDRLF